MTTDSDNPTLDLDTQRLLARIRKLTAEGDASSSAAEQVAILTREANRAERNENASDSRHGVYWIEEIDDTRSRAMISELNMLHRLDPTQPITLYINSFGGEVMGGFMLHDHLRYLSALGHSITTIATGACMSMAVPIWCAGDPGRRFLAGNCTFMFHEVQLGDAEGSLTQLEDVQTLGTKLYERLLTILAETSTLTVPRLKRLIKNRERYLDASEMVEYGFGTILTGNDEIIVG